MRQIEYAVRLNDGREFIVTSAKYNYSYDSFEAFLIIDGRAEKLTIHSVDRKYDGGTTTIVTNKGTFFSPTPFDFEHQLPPTNFSGIGTIKLEDEQAEQRAEAVGITLGGNMDEVTAQAYDHICPK